MEGTDSTCSVMLLEPALNLVCCTWSNTGRYLINYTHCRWSRAKGLPGVIKTAHTTQKPLALLSLLATETKRKLLLRDQRLLRPVKRSTPSPAGLGGSCHVRGRSLEATSFLGVAVNIRHTHLTNTAPTPSSDLVRFVFNR